LAHVTGKAGKRPSGSAEKAPDGGGQPSGNGGRGAAAPAEPDSQIPYEQARDQLTDVVKRLESGGLTLEESLALWERGEHLADVCTQWLEGARARLAAARPPTTEPGDGAAPF
jgi:exodeoxyribonuclease VII small subunit